ncbi:glycine betaine/L-proline ABC transporter ATP-binding protein [Fusibacter paucivorans]|uniref:Quaternary amine transport ATP-binding protein n=1 Tax=Fusibacter paucivorans TaxID=76009 RepID=A0ABS5PMV2_9FIRM|nr:glycine betaine/L-proline ABC transporter ATP-binding protein [Fusibacter paucivorans]MBS7526227.1 glycine betaine/L-proline ABC transporter ATP-binding protein [Fusibacter paucivorans]
MAKVTVKSLYKIYGPRPQKALPLVKQGISKDELLKKTGNGIGINDASFDVQEGEIFVVMGLSGSGKSTLIRCLNRLIEPTAGEIHIDGQNIVGCSDDVLLQVRRKKVAMVFQHFALFPHRTVAENVAYGLEVQKVPPEERIKKAYEALEMVGLSGYEESFPSELSGGMQQRVGLARALATEADILLMDEAFSALDPLIRTEMQDELIALQERMKKTIIFITHDLDEALKIGDRIAIMKEGVVVQIGTPEEILDHPADDYVRAFIKDVNRAKVLTASAVMKKPDGVVTLKDGIRVAMRKMEEVGISSIFVVDKARILQGIVTIDDAIDALKRGETSLQAIINNDIETTDGDTPLLDLMPIAIKTKYPIAVINDSNKLLGIIVRVSVLAGILGEEAESND